MTDAEVRAPLIEHVRELRTRLMWALAFVILGAGLGYLVHERLLNIVQQPLHQTLYYTTPTGALGFILKICVTFGILVGLPVIMYQIFAFFGPLLNNRTKKGVVAFTFLSVILALSGALFAYYLTLPAALHFLVGFSSDNIRSLITANEYFNFAFAYILGFAVLFQIPLILAFINRITPLQPKKLAGSIRYIVVASFVVAAIITPTPDPMNQAMMAAPAIVLYLLSIIIIIAINARSNRKQNAAINQPHFETQQRYTPSHRHEPALAPTPLSQPAQVMATAVTPRAAVQSAAPVQPQKRRRPQHAVGMEFVRPTTAVYKPRKVTELAQTTKRPLVVTRQTGVISDFV